MSTLLPGRSLRGRLIVSYALVVFVTLVGVLVALSFLLPGYQSRQAEIRLAEMAQPTMRILTELASRNATPDEMRAALDELAENAGLRMLVLGRNSIVFIDTSRTGNLEGRSVALSRPPVPPVGPRAGLLLRGRFVATDSTPYQYAALPVAISDGRQRPELGVLVIAQTEPRWLDLRSDLAWRLAVASGVALAVAVALATLVARSLYRPIARLTAASEAMAVGQYDQQVPVEGPAELAALAGSFNRMADEVRSSRQTLREFVSNASHELRTPLTAIRGFVEALRDGTVTDQGGREQSLTVIDNELRRLQRLVAALLDLSRIESGQANLRRDPVDLVGVVRQCADIIAQHAEERGVALRIDVPSDFPLVVGDADRLEQVLANLLDNALRYTGPGGQITIALASHARWVDISVIDSGSGIPAHALPHLFERFYTADPARAGHGAGLGLAIAREIALAHGGNITVSSTMGEGSTFTISLPHQPVAASARQPVAPT